MILGDFGPFLGRSGVTLGSPRDDFGIVLASSWAGVGVVLTILTPFWALFGLFLDHFRVDPRSLCGHSGSFWHRFAETHFFLPPR